MEADLANDLAFCVEGIRQRAAHNETEGVDPLIDQLAPLKEKLAAEMKQIEAMRDVYIR